MKCSDYIEWIGQRLDGSLPRERFAELEGHLTECRRCRAEYALQKKIMRALKQDEPGGLSADFTQRVMSRTLEIAQARTCRLDDSQRVARLIIGLAVEDQRIGNRDTVLADRGRRQP